MADDRSNSATDMTDQNVPTGAPSPDPQPAQVDAGGPQVSDQAGIQAQPPSAAPAPAAAAPPPKPGSVLKNILQGALAGFVQGGGPGAVVGAINPNLTKTALANKQAIQQADVQKAQGAIKFQDAQAANYAADTAYKKIMVEQLPKQLQATIASRDQEMVKFLVDHGVQPAFVTNEDSPEALKAAYEQSHQANGAVPALAVFHSGGQLMGFDLNQLANTSSILGEVNRMRGVQGSPSIETAQWNNPKLTNPGSKTKLVNDAAHFFNPVPEAGDKLNGQIQQYQNYLAKAQQLPDETPNKDKTVGQLKDALKVLQDSRASRQTEKIQTGSAIAGNRAAANAGAQYKEFAGDNGATYWMPVAQGAKAGMPSSKNATAVQPFIKTAEDSEKSFQMFNDAYKDFKSGVPTGAQSMLALSQHLATTFGNVKGARVTKDMIQEHLGARSISDAALVATQKLTNGDVLSPDQWDAFKELIGQSRKYAWAVAAKESSARGISIRGLAPKDLGGQGDIHNLMLGQQKAQPTSSPAGSGGFFSGVPGAVVR